ncbi:outer membrane protein assembly factor BamB family protein [Allostreptomyces psammosilenae]|uniref:Pyrrolo-quinoline quinone repeat domain-containing protein n=1 Tax=Allostreptomyces psammosilenae TaxID=1892865 RepID=A0A852ZY17_9ACTN|nr:PQQ-binding-like beta-propeller repeat protein [Allostreptomyces psammosilenae]NYI03172.1 hypothetical protein [Allostreptomyces psammosilenae]
MPYPPAPAAPNRGRMPLLLAVIGGVVVLAVVAVIGVQLLGDDAGDPTPPGGSSYSGEFEHFATDYAHGWDAAATEENGSREDATADMALGYWVTDSTLARISGSTATGFSRSDGSRQWQVEAPDGVEGICAATTSQSGSLAALAYEAGEYSSCEEVWLVDAGTGERLSEVELPDEETVTALTVVDDTLVVGTYSGAFVIDPASGEVLTEVAGSSECMAEGYVGAGAGLLLTSQTCEEESLLAFSLDGGERLWELDLPGGDAGSMSLLSADPLVIAVSGEDGGYYALSVDERGEARAVIKYNQPCGELAIYPGVVQQGYSVTGDTLVAEVIGGDDTVLAGYSLVDGSEKWCLRGESDIPSNTTPLRADGDGVIAVSGDWETDPRLVWISAADGAVTEGGRFAAEEVCEGSGDLCTLLDDGTLVDITEFTLYDYLVRTYRPE